MSDHAMQTGRIGGFTLVAVASIGQWLADHGLTNSMTLIALAGLGLQVFTSIPAILRTIDTLRERRGK